MGIESTLKELTASNAKEYIERYIFPTTPDIFPAYLDKTRPTSL